MNQNQPISPPEPLSGASKTSLIQKMVGAPAAPPGASVPAAPASPDAPKTPTGVASPEAPAASAEAPDEKKSTKAAKESKALRLAREEREAAKAERSALKAELEQAKAAREELKTFNEARELFTAGKVKDAIKLLGTDPLKAYQELTNNYLENDIDLKPKDPIQEKIKELDPYLESIKKREAALKEKEDAAIVASTIKTEVHPIFEKPEEYECMFDFYNPDGKRSLEETKELIAQNVFSEGARYLKEQLGGDYKRLLKEFGNNKTFFQKVAQHLEKQLEHQIEQTVQHAKKLSKFKTRFESASTGEEPKKVTETKQDLKLLDANSPDNFTLDSVSTDTSYRVQRTANPDRRSQIDKLLKDNGLA